MQSPVTGASSARLIDLLMPVKTDTTVPAGAAAPRVLWEPFADAARAHPDRPAIIDARQTITYGDLLHAALRIAVRVREARADHPAPVAVHMRKGWPQVAASIGIQLAGAAYLPVPADWPPLRVSGLMDATAARIAIVDDDDDAGQGLPGGVTVIRVNGTETGPEVRVDDLVRARDPGSLAYIIATSGTTGTPKAVMIEHAAAWTTIAAINERFRVDAHDRVLGLSALSFDLSVWDIFGVLAAGGTLVLPDAARLRDPEHWIALCQTAGVTIWNSVPAFARMLVEGGMPRGQALRQLPSLRLMMLSGDWIPLSLAQRVRQQRPDLDLVSLGGATEAAIWSIVHPIDAIDPTWKSIPYGKALPGQSIHVLDDALETLPPWAEGEIHIGGAGVARGYYRDETLTNARFVRHPRTGARLYKTGDLGRLWPDGTVELLGRIDSQVKISGHRVELGEIEAHVHALPGVRAAVVAHRPVGSLGRKELIAYVVPAGAPQASREAIADPIARVRFKLRQPGLRRFPDAVQPVVALEAPSPDARAAAFRARRTHRAFADTPVPRASIGTLLAQLSQVALEESAIPKRRYPSAGSLYPVQIYLHARPGRCAGLDAGTYYYDPATHGLRALSAGTDLAPAWFGGVNLRPAEQSAFAIVLIAELAAIEPLYPEQARDFCLLEAGYIGQLLMLAAPDAGIGLCPIGGLDGTDWRAPLQLGDSHIFLHAFVGGVPADDPRAARAELDIAAALHATGSADPASSTTTREWRTLLESRLPPHMIPSTWVVLDALPLTENGKIDRNHLPEPARERQDHAMLDALLTPTESSLLAILHDLLGDRPIPLDQGFFEAGGDSLLLLELQDRLQQQLAREVPLAHFFQYPTIRALARWLDETATT